VIPVQYTVDDVPLLNRLHPWRERDYWTHYVFLEFNHIDGENNLSADCLGRIDIGFDDEEDRFSDEDVNNFPVIPGAVISMFIKIIFPKTMAWIGPGPMTNRQNNLSNIPSTLFANNFSESLIKAIKSCRTNT
jgi:hypothetical protein